MALQVCSKVFSGKPWIMSVVTSCGLNREKESTGEAWKAAALACRNRKMTELRSRATSLEAKKSLFESKVWELMSLMAEEEALGDSFEVTPLEEEVERSGRKPTRWGDSVSTPSFSKTPDLKGEVGTVC